MAHEVENMMYVGETPWHGLGNRVEADLDISNLAQRREALRQAGLDWRVLTVPMQFPHVTADGVDMRDVDGHRAFVRNTDGKVLTVRSDKFQPFQNSELFELLADVSSSGAAMLHTAGSLKGGRRVWALLKAGDFEVEKGDQVDQFLLASNGHDGSMALRVRFTAVRVVCANTEAMALANFGEAEASGKAWRTRHVGDVAAKAEDLRQALGLVQGQAYAHAEFCRSLASQAMSHGAWEFFAHRMFPEAEDATERQVANAERQRETLRGLYEGATAWDALNAVTNWTSHLASRSADARLNSAWFGASANLVDKARATLHELYPERVTDYGLRVAA